MKHTLLLFTTLLLGACGAIDWEKSAERWCDGPKQECECRNCGFNQ